MSFPSFNNVPPKDPLDVLPYAFDWTAFLPVGSTIVSATVSVPSGITLVAPAVVNGSVVNFTLSGGVANNAYLISCFIQMNPPDAANRSFTLNVKSL
ncbi:phage fiber-tail adaptor protein [Caballeronia sp. KNU42]